MDFVVSMLRETAMVAVVVSVLVTAIAIRCSKLEYVGAIALACGFFAGWVDQDWANLKPARYLDWLPYSAMLLAIVGLLSVRVPGKYRWLPQALTIALVTWLMVPSFPRLQPTRPVAITIITSVSWSVVQVSTALKARVPQRILITGLMAMGTSVSLVLVQSFGLKFAQIAGMLTAALAGPLIFRSERSAAGLTCVFLPLLCNLLFMGFASSSSDVPWYSFALVPFAVLSLWFYPRDSDERKLQRSVIACVLFAIVLLLAVVPALFAHPPWEEELARLSAESATACG